VNARFMFETNAQIHTVSLELTRKSSCTNQP
jgi:hypothetical protein